MQLIRFSGSGTETTWHATRRARAYTGQSVIVEFEGHFHGYHDCLGFSAWPPLDRAGPEDMPVPYAESAGVPPELAEFVIVLPWNNAAVLERTLRQRGHEIAAVMLEPVNYDSGTLLPRPAISRPYASYGGAGSGRGRDEDAPARAAPVHDPAASGRFR